MVADRVGETPCVFLAGLYRAERTIAERLKRLANGTLPWPWIDPDKAVPWVEHSSYRGRTTRANFENHFADFEVQEILREPYTGRPFQGYEDIDLSFDELETLVRNNRPDWKAALENAKGIYLITDTKTARRYVGSAYGELGIWSRWRSYVESGHGGNVELRSLANDTSLGYCRANFRFAVLEHRSSRTPDDVVVERETFWKHILFTRGEGGLNRN